MLRLTCTIPGRGRKAYAFADADGAIVIGSSPDCSVELPPGGCPARALRLDLFPDHLRVTALTDDIAVRVGGKLVAEQASVEHVAAPSGSFPALAITIGDVHVRADYEPDEAPEPAHVSSSSIPARESTRGVPPSPAAQRPVGAVRSGPTSKIGTPRVNPDLAATERPQPPPPSRAATPSTRMRHRDMFSASARAVEGGGLWDESDEAASIAEKIIVGEPDEATLVHERPKSAEFSEDMMSAEEREALAEIGRMKQPPGESAEPAQRAPELPSTTPPPVTTTLAEQHIQNAQAALPATLASMRDGVGSPSESIPPMPLMSDITPSAPANSDAKDASTTPHNDNAATEPLRVRSSPLASVSERRPPADEKWADLENAPLEPTKATSRDQVGVDATASTGADNEPSALDDPQTTVPAAVAGPQTARSASEPGTAPVTAPVTAEGSAEPDLDPFQTDAQLIGEYLKLMPTQPMPAVRQPSRPTSFADSGARKPTKPTAPTGGEVAVRLGGESVEHIDTETVLKELKVSATRLMRAVAAGDVTAIRYGDQTLFRRDEVERLTRSKTESGEEALPRSLTVSDSAVPRVVENEEAAVPYESVEFAAMGQSRELAAARSGMLAAVSEGSPRAGHADNSDVASNDDADKGVISIDELDSSEVKAEQQLNTWFSLPTVDSARSEAIASSVAGAENARQRAGAPTPSTARAPIGPTSAAASLQRRATASYHSQMLPFRNYPLTVEITARDGARGGKRTRDISAVSGEPFDIGVQATWVTVIPRLPGCIVVPDRIDLDLREQPATAEFWVTPTARGNYNRDANSLVDGPRMPCAYIDIVQGARRVDRITTPMRVVGGWHAKVAAALGLIAPLGAVVASELGAEPRIDTVGRVTDWTSTWSPLDPLVTLGLVAGASFLIVAALLTALVAPREAEPRTVDLNLDQ